MVNFVHVGALNIVTGLGPDAGGPLSAHDGIDKVDARHVDAAFWDHSDRLPLSPSKSSFMKE